MVKEAGPPDARVARRSRGARPGSTSRKTEDGGSRPLRAHGTTVAVLFVLVWGLAGTALGQAPPTYSVHVLAVDQSPNLTAQSAMTISMELSSAANVQFVYFTFCQLTSPVCYTPVVMSPHASNWYVGTTQTMPNYPGMTPGVRAGYNITIEFTDNSTFTEPQLPNAFSNLTVVSSVSGEYMFEVTVRPQVFDLGGVVTDTATGAGIAGATVALALGNSTVTDGTGAYTFANLFNGTYTVTVTASGYTATTATVVVAGKNQVKNFAITNPNAPSRSNSSGGRSGLAAIFSGPTLYAAVGGVAIVVALLSVWAMRGRRGGTRNEGARPPAGAQTPPNGPG